MRKKISKIVYIIIFIVVILLPIVLFPIGGRQNAESEEAMVAMPSIVTYNEKSMKNTLNIHYFSQLGDYFTYNFAFRQNLVTADAKIKSALFHTSSQSNVVLGKNGWLFYGSSMDDYLGKKTMSDLQVREAVENLELMQKTLKADNKKFVFAIAPNKNSLYQQYMPSGYRIKPSDRNSTRMRALLEKSDVNYVDLYQLFKSQKQVLYHKTDSHWDNRGAAMVNKALLSAAGRKSTDYSKYSVEKRQDFRGDLYHMLYPTSDWRDREYYYSKKRDYTYDNKIDSTYDSIISTTNPKKNGSVVMFRDSFGNSLLPFTADEYGKGYFSRLVPYQVFKAYGKHKADTVIVELVERNLNQLQENAPVLASKDISSKVLLPEDRDNSLKPAVHLESDAESGYLKIKGSLDSKNAKRDPKIYISLYNKKAGFGYLYEAYHVSEGSKDKKHPEDGFALYADTKEIPSGDYQVSAALDMNDKIFRSKDLTSVKIAS